MSPMCVQLANGNRKFAECSAQVKRHEAQNACSRHMPDINETGLGHTPQRTVHNTKSILPVNKGNVKGICSKVCLFTVKFCLPSLKAPLFTR